MIRKNITELTTNLLMITNSSHSCGMLSPKQRVMTT